MMLEIMRAWERKEAAAGVKRSHERAIARNFYWLVLKPLLGWRSIPALISMAFILFWVVPPVVSKITLFHRGLYEFVFVFLMDTSW